MADSFLRISAVNKKFGGVCALDSVTLEIEKGEIHCLIGENGSGKSTDRKSTRLNSSHP